MASPDVLDFAKLTAPIPGDRPAGIDLRADTAPGSVYYAIKDARNAARAAERQLVDGDDSVPPPDWKPVLQHALKATAEKTKDLVVVAYLVEALVRLNGFAGLRDGFRLARELIERYWEGLYPRPDEDGLNSRMAPLTGLNGDDAEGTLIQPITRVPLTDNTSVGRLACSHYQEAVALAKITDPKIKEKRLAAGAMSLDKFQKAVGETSGKFFADLVADLGQAQDEFARLNAALDQCCNGQAPPTSNIRTALATCLHAVKDVARGKLEVTAPPRENGKPAAAVAAAPAAAPAAADAIQTREDAFRVVLNVAEFFRKTEPHTIVSYALEQVVRWGRMPLPDLFQELIPDEAPRKGLFKQVGIKPAEAAKQEDKKK
jgi:type VI secretion system protein ImpA